MQMPAKAAILAVSSLCLWSLTAGADRALAQDPPSPVKETKVNVFEEHLKAESLGQMVATADAVVIGDIVSEPATRRSTRRASRWC